MEQGKNRFSHSDWILLAGSLLLIAAGVVMRLYALGKLPGGLFYDEAYDGLDALRVLHGARPLYFAGNYGREPFFVYLMAATIQLFGRSVLGIRAAAAICGVLTIPATYLLGRAWANRRVGLLSAAILSITLWHFHLSRVGFRAIALPLFIALALGLGALGLRSRSRWLLVASGSAFGLSFYTYLPARFTPIALLLMGVYALIWHRGWVTGRWRSLLWMGGAACIVVLPLAIFTGMHPDVVFLRTGEVAIWNNAVCDGPR